MNITTKVITFLAAIAFSPAAYSDSAVDRCEVSHCTCRVRPGPAPTASTFQRQDERRNMVFFDEDDATVDRHEERSLSQWLQSQAPGRGANLTIIGYTDGCGSAEYNRGLAQQRAEAVRAIAMQTAPNANYDIIIAGETTTAHTSAARRVDVVMHTQSSFRTRIERVPADVYLIDASGSMWSGWRSWQDMVNASIRPGARVYVSMMTGCSHNQELSTIRPQSGTEIWYSYWRVLDYMSPGQTLAIISDMRSNVPLSRSESRRIAEKAESRNINVVVIQ